MVIFSLNINNYLDNPLHKFCVNSWSRWKANSTNITDIIIFNEQSPEYQEFLTVINTRKYKYNLMPHTLADAFRMYILAKYENYLWLDSDIYIGNPGLNWNLDFYFAENWGILYNGKNLDFYKRLFNIYLTIDMTNLFDTEITHKFGLPANNFEDLNIVEQYKGLLHLGMLDDIIEKNNLVKNLEQLTEKQLYKFIMLFCRQTVSEKDVIDFFEG